MPRKSRQPTSTFLPLRPPLPDADARAMILVKIKRLESDLATLRSLLDGHPERRAAYQYCWFVIPDSFEEYQRLMQYDCPIPRV